jgi:hypothetical protein
MRLQKKYLPALGALSVLLSSCVHVAPYERGHLAHPTMAAEAGPGEAHMQAVHEGATGGAAGVEGGCGCN